MLEKAIDESGFNLLKIGYQGWLPENGLPAKPIFLLNQLLTRIPLANLFSHDYYAVAEKRL